MMMFGGREGVGEGYEWGAGMGCRMIGERVSQGGAGVSSWD